ncbi:MAG: hypothetical protein KTR15_04920 [Phycisphaeraceae bacterium]|nr:hypothetical protein [Phycisphaeraceae bacterium]
MPTSPTKRLLIAGLLAVPMTITAGDVLAKSCKSGSCGGPNNLEKAIVKVEGAESVVTNADLQTAYDKIETVAQEVDDLNAGSSSKVRGGLKELAGKLEKRVAAELKDARDRYFEGYIEESLAKFEELAELKGLPSAKKAKQELDKENDRVAWRLANKQAAKHIDSKQFGEARLPLNDMQRLSRRTDYTDQAKAAIKKFSDQMMPQVEAAEKMVAQEQYEDAYASLIEISRLTHARESALAARKLLGKHASLEGMRQAKGEYDAAGALTEAKSWFEAIENPSTREQQQFQQKLEAIASSYKGTCAAEQAQQLLITDNAQAAR